MIIDIRTRLAPTGPAPAHTHDSPPCAAEASGCVDVAIVVADAARDAPGRDPIGELASVLSHEPGRRLGVATLDPTAANAQDELERAVGLGFVGIAISPADHGYRPTHDECVALLEQCAARNLPVFVANPGCAHPKSVMEYARPSLLDEVARLTPNTTFVLGDLGHAWIDEALVLVRKHERFFAELSTVVRTPWLLYRTLMSAHEQGVLHKLLFGSGHPDETPEAAIERIYTINGMRGGSSLPTVPREALRSIVERDALQSLGIERRHTTRRLEPAAPPKADNTPAEGAVEHHHHHHPNSSHSA